MCIISGRPPPVGSADRLPISRSCRMVSDGLYWRTMVHHGCIDVECVSVEVNELEVSYIIGVNTKY